MNYFEFYQLPVSFLLDENLFKKKYFELSKKYHPDFHRLSSLQEQDKILELSSFNNDAYKTLGSFDNRIEYILELKGLVFEGEKYELPNDFLVEMMEVNETLMEMEFEKNVKKISEIKSKIHSIENDLRKSIEVIIQKNSNSENDLKIIKNYFYKKKYLTRLQDSLSKFQS